MFDKIVFSPVHDDNTVIDAGAIAEAILYYKSAIVPFYQGGLVHFVRKIGVDNFLRFVEETDSEVILVREAPAVVCKDGFFYFATKDIAQRNSGGKFSSVSDEDLLRETLECFGPSFYKRVRSKVNVRPSNFYLPKGFDLKESAYDDMKNKEFVRRSIIKLVLAMDQAYLMKGKSFKFDVCATETGRFRVDTDIDFKEITEAIDPHSRQIMGVDFIVNFFISACLDFFISAYHEAEIYTSPWRSGILREKMLPNGLGQKYHEICEFEEIVLDGRNIRDVINKGEKNFRDILDVHQKSKKFKDWLGEKSQDKNLVTEYFKDVTSRPIFDNTPAKVIRYLFTSGLGFIPVTFTPSLRRSDLESFG